MNEGGLATSSQPTQPENAMESVFERGRSPLLRPFLFLVGLAALGLIVFLGYRLASDTSASSGNPEQDDDAVTATRLDPVGEASVAELQPALDAVAAQHDEPAALYRVEINAEEIVVVVQVPGEPELLDRYIWSNGELSRPFPLEPSEAQVEALPENLFGAEEVDPDVVASVLADSATHHPDDPDAEIVTTDIDVYAGLGPDDPDVVLVVRGRDYARPEGDDTWSLTYGPDGSLLRRSPTGEASG